MSFKKLGLAALSGLLLMSGSAHAGLVITGAFDGPLSGGLPKAIELYVDADGTDLSLYGIGSANNAGGTDNVELVFSGTANKGDFIYVASDNNGPGGGGFEDYFGFAPTFSGGAANINGDDSLELFTGLIPNDNGTPGDTNDDFTEGTVIDVFGVVGVDGSNEPWDHLDGWAYRNDGTGPDGSTFSLSSWSFSGINVNDGQTSNATAATPFPIGTYSAVPEPASFVLLLAGSLATLALRRK